MKRNEIPEQYKWKMEDLYASNDAWETDFLKLTKGLEDLKAFEGTLKQSAEQLLKLMEKNDELGQLAENVYVYANQRMHEDTANDYYQGLAARAQMLLAQRSEASSFVEPEILDIPENQLEEMLCLDGLKKYETYFRRLLRRKEHILSKEIEEL